MIAADVLEVELRSLPGVACVAVDPADVSVLVLPDTDADALRVLVSAVLATHAIDSTVRVIGGATRPAARRSPRRVAAMAASAVVLVGAALVVAGVGPQSSRASDPVASVSSPVPGESAPAGARWPRPSALLPQQLVPAAVAVPAAALAERTAVATAPVATRPVAATRVVASAAPVAKTPSVPRTTAWVPTSEVVISSTGADGSTDGSADRHDRHAGAERRRTHGPQKAAAAAPPRRGHQ